MSCTHWLVQPKSLSWWGTRDLMHQPIQPKSLSWWGGVGNSLIFQQKKLQFERRLFLAYSFLSCCEMSVIIFYSTRDLLLCLNLSILFLIIVVHQSSWMVDWFISYLCQQGLATSTLASSFGKVITSKKTLTDYKPEDLASTLLSAFTYNIAQASSFSFTDCFSASKLLTLKWKYWAKRNKFCQLLH